LESLNSQKGLKSLKFEEFGRFGVLCSAFSIPYSAFSVFG